MIMSVNRIKILVEHIAFCTYISHVYTTGDAYGVETKTKGYLRVISFFHRTLFTMHDIFSLYHETSINAVNFSIWTYTRVCHLNVNVRLYMSHHSGIVFWIFLFYFFFGRGVYFMIQIDILVWPSDNAVGFQDLLVKYKSHKRWFYKI